MPLNQATLGRMLRDARVNRNITQEAAAEVLGLPRTAIVQMEAGNRLVNTLELSQLADLYRRSVADFFHESSEKEDDVLVALYRLAPDLRGDEDVKREMLRCLDICKQGVALREILHINSTSGPPHYELPPPTSVFDAVRQGQTVAAQERKRQGLGENPIPDVSDLLATQGIWPSGVDLPDGMSGMFLHHPSTGMVILVNVKHAKVRKRFSYAHEYGHALFDRQMSVSVTSNDNRSELAEVRANAFAAAFLMPEGGVRGFLAQQDKGLGSRESISVFDNAMEVEGQEIEAKWRPSPGSQHITCRVIAMAAHHFRVSYQAAAYRLKSLRYLNKEELQNLLAQEEIALGFLELIKMKKDLTDTDKRPDRELVSEVASLAVEARAREEISEGRVLEIAELLNISGESLLQFADTCNA